MQRGGIFTTLFLLLALAGSTGCAVTQPFGAMSYYTKKFFTLGGQDYADPTEEEAEAWVTEVGVEARGDQPRERDPDQWWKQNIMSEKARSIERNLGFD